MFSFLSKLIRRGKSFRLFRKPLSVEHLETRNVLSSSFGFGTQLLPNEAFTRTADYRYQWALNQVDAPAAWDTTQGSTSVVIANIDTGVDYKHPDLYKNIWVNQGEIPASVKEAITKDAGWDVDGDGLITLWDLNDRRNQGKGKITDQDHDGRITGADLLTAWSDNSDADDNGYTDDIIGWNFVTNTNDPYDDSGHGTHTAGILGAVGDNGQGVAGLNWHTQIMSLKFITADNDAELDWAADAIRYAADNGAQVSNNSWLYVDGDTSDPIFQAIEYAQEHNQLVVAAAGNNRLNNDTSPNASYPASFDLDNIISVTATDSRDRLPVWANTGANTVDIAAPGVSVLSTVPGGGYAYGTGTSMATPYVTGTAALIIAQHPDLSYSQVRDAILGGADPLKTLAGKTSTGGRLNTAAALDKAAILAEADPVTADTAAGADTADGGGDAGTTDPVAKPGKDHGKGQASGTLDGLVDPAVVALTQFVFAGQSPATAAVLGQLQTLPPLALAQQAEFLIAIAASRQEAVLAPVPTPPPVPPPTPRIDFTGAGTDSSVPLFLLERGLGERVELPDPNQQQPPPRDSARQGEQAPPRSAADSAAGQDESSWREEQSGLNDFFSQLADAPELAGDYTDGPDLLAMLADQLEVSAAVLVLFAGLGGCLTTANPADPREDAARRELPSVR